MAYDDAIKSGAMAFFDEKYGDKVRVLSVGDKKNPFSVELCGGTHLTNTLQVSLFKIVSESSVASGVRRIEAITSSEALKFYEQRNQTLSSLESLMNLKNEAVVSRVDQLSQQNRNLQKEIENLKLKVIQGGTSSGGALHDKAITFPGKNIKAVIEKIDNADGNILRNLVDQIRDKLKERTVVMLVSHQESKVALCVGLTKDLVGEFQASKLIQPIAEMLGGKGGGRPDFAQAGGNKPEMISQALEEFKKSLK
jgi:alanyl-tRNA synthetase